MAQRVLIHDYAGHVAQVEVSRELARRGYEVMHLFAAGLETPRGQLERNAADPASFQVKPVEFKSAFQKHNYLRRQLQELGYGRALVKAMRAFAPDIVLSANTPLFPQALLERACKKDGTPFIFWMTDIYGVVVNAVLSRQMAFVGRAIGAFYLWLERRLLTRADGIIVLTDAFRDFIHESGVARSDVEVIPVCAPHRDIPVGAKDNAWSRAQGLAQTRNLIYAGTLGHKHNPGLLLALAKGFAGVPDIRIVVVSEGPGADFLKSARAEQGLANLVIVPFQPFEQLGNVFASADVLLTILETDAAVFSTPSKVLSQLCAGRAQLAAMPVSNYAARLIGEAGAGIVVPPADADAFLGAAKRLLGDDAMRGEMGQKGRAYAESRLAVDYLAGRYERLIGELLARRGALPAALTVAESTARKAE